MCLCCCCCCSPLSWLIEIHAKIINFTRAPCHTVWCSVARRGKYFARDFVCIALWIYWTNSAFLNTHTAFQRFVNLSIIALESESCFGIAPSRPKTRKIRESISINLCVQCLLRAMWFVVAYIWFRNIETRSTLMVAAPRVYFFIVGFCSVVVYCICIIREHQRVLCGGIVDELFEAHHPG